MEKIIISQGILNILNSKAINIVLTEKFSDIQELKWSLLVWYYCCWLIYE